ncbi:MAG: response regulator, partial [Gammaproteobacteria bacterium]|nr:response regulator [Gammaproteobacteria bacterium]
MNKVSLLILDDESEVLNALKRVLRKEFELFLFLEPLEALEFYRKNPVPLVLSDMRMPVMDGATFLTHVAEINPRSKRFLLTGHCDLDRTIEAVNQGHISRYFAKPWDNEQLLSELTSASNQYHNEIKSLKIFKINHQQNSQLSREKASMETQQIKQQQHLKKLKKNFNVFIELYADSIALHTQEGSRHNYRIGAQARYIALQLGCDPLTAYQIYVAGLLYETGKLAVAQMIIEQPYDQLLPQQQHSFDHFNQHSVTMLSTGSPL